MEHLLKEAVRFFKGEPGLSRMLEKMIERYRSLGRIGGTVRIQQLTTEEKEALSQWFRKDYTHQSSATISMEKFKQALGKTKFAGLGVQEILEGVHGEPIVTKMEEQEQFAIDKKAFFSALRDDFPYPACRYWLRHVVEKQQGTRSIHSAYGQDAVRLKGQLQHVLRALCQLPSVGNHMNEYQIPGSRGSYERLPVFASRITGDPHAFDLHTEQGRYLINALQVLRLREDEHYVYQPSPSAEQVTELLQRFGLIRDDILNFVTCTGVVGIIQKKSMPGRSSNTHDRKSGIDLWQTAALGRHVLNVPLREVIQADSFVPVYVTEHKEEAKRQGSAERHESSTDLQPVRSDKVVFVVENSGVFSSVLDHFIHSPLWPPLVCTHGQFKLATLLLIDRLVEEGSTVYYSGDFDPAGLQMASRMKRRHPEHVRLWRMSVDDYRECRQGRALNTDYMRNLAAISAPELKEVAREIKQTGTTAYQEDLISVLVEDIKMLIRARIVT